jgi:hypothetical protein
MTKTVKVRIAVAIDPTGTWSSSGYSGFEGDKAMDYAAECLGPGENRFWLTAELPVPEIPEIAAVVEPASND